MLNQISENDKKAIYEAAENLYYVEKDSDGKCHIDLSADYTDDNKFLLQVAYDHRDDDKAPTKVYGNDDELMSYLQDAISEVWYEAIWNAEDDILRKAGFEPNDDVCEPQKDWLRENIFIDPPYDHYLDQSMRINIMLCTSSEPNHCFSDIHAQYLAMAEPDRLTDGSVEACKQLIEMDTSLSRLVEQQGHTMEELAATMKEYRAFFYDEEGSLRQHIGEDGNPLKYDQEFKLFSSTHNKFLTSLCCELENQGYEEGILTVLAEVSMRDFATMMKGDSVITMPADCMCGIFSPDHGAGSVLEVELEKPLVFTRDAIYDVQIEGASPDFGYNLDYVYGLVHNCWKSPSSIDHAITAKEHENEGKDISPTLDEMLKSASARASAQQSQGKTFDEPTR